MKIQFTVTNQHIEANVSSKIVADSRNYLEAVFFFTTPDWDSLTKTVIFSTKFGTYNVILKGDTCPVPHECIIAGDIEVSVFGGDRITTDIAKVKVFPSGYKTGETPKAPTPDVYAEILDRLKTIQAGTVSQADIEAAVNSYMEKNPVKTLTEDQVKEIVNEVISSANQPESSNEESLLEAQSEEVDVQDLVSEYVTAYFNEHSGDFVGPAGNDGQNGVNGKDGKDGADGIDATMPLVISQSVSEIESGKVYVFGSTGAANTFTFVAPGDETVENTYVVKFEAVSNDEAPLFKRGGSDGYITPRILSPIVTGEKYKAVYEWSDGSLRIM